MSSVTLRWRQKLRGRGAAQTEAQLLVHMSNRRDQGSNEINAWVGLGAHRCDFVAGQTIPNLVLVPLGAGITITFSDAAGTVNVLGDLVGYYHP